MLTTLLHQFRLAALVLVTMTARSALADGAPADPKLPPVIYTLRSKSEAVETPWSLGLVVGLVSEGYRKAHEKFLTALQSQTGSEDAANFLHPLACIAVTNPSAGCRRLVEVASPPTDAALATLLAAEPSKSALVMGITIIFDGRFFQTPTGLQEWHLNDEGAVARGRTLGVTYISTYSKSQHQADIDQKRNEAPFNGNVGSKEARMHYWLGGSHPRLPAELDRAFDQMATLYSAALAPSATGILAGDDSGRGALPRVRDLVGTDKSKCATLHGDFRVASDQGELLWLVFPKPAKAVRHIFYIEPRCGFDY